MYKRHKKLFGFLILIVGLISLSLGSILVQADTPTESNATKQLAAPPAEMVAGNFRLPSPEQAATRSHSALLPVNLQQNKDGSWSWTGALAVDNTDDLSIMVLSGEQSWEVNVQAPGQKSLVSLNQAVSEESVSVKDSTLGMGDTQFSGKVYTFNEAQTGRWNVQVNATSVTNQKATIDGYLLVASKTPYKLLSYLTTYDLLVGNNIGLATYIYQAGEVDDRAIKPAALTNVVKKATVRVVYPNGTETTLTMNGSQATDGVFEAVLKANQAGEYTAQVTVEGFTPTGEPFVRTTQHVFPVIDTTMSVANKTVTASAVDNVRLQVGLNVEGNVAGNATFKVGAEVWGTAKDGQAVPVAWIGGLATTQQTKAGLVLPLTLDSRWIALAQANAPFELREVTIQDVNTSIPVARLNTVSMDVTRMPEAASKDVRSISGEMLTGPRPDNVAKGTEAAGKLLLVHGYCAGSNPWPGSHFTNYAKFYDTNQNRTHDEFAQLIKNFGSQFSSFGVVAHSQGGDASLHLYTYYWSGLDYSSGSRLIQSVGTPYQGTALAGNIAVLGEIFGVGCGANWDLSYDGASLWLSGIPNWARDDIYFHTTSFTDKWWRYDYCQIASDLLLDDPDDGVIEKWAGQLSNGNNLGHKTGWCHTNDMRDPSQTTDSSRNSNMNTYANR